MLETKGQSDEASEYAGSLALAAIVSVGGGSIAAQRATGNAAANAVEPDGTTPLHRAVHRNDVKAADALIRSGADVNAVNRYGVPPLSLAATNGNAAVLELLLKAGANPNATQSEGETALMTAARTGIPAAVKTLLAHGADVNAKESWRGQTALMWAAAEGHADTIRAAPRGGRPGQRPFQRRLDGDIVCGPRRKDSGGQDAARGRSERRRYAARQARSRARRGCGRSRRAVAASGRLRKDPARSCSPSAARISSWLRRCSTRAPIQMLPRRGGRRSIISPGFASPAPGATILRPTAPATWIASRSSESSRPMAQM